MTQTIAIQPKIGVGNGRPTVWGLTARELHDAYWNARGVQCVRRGEGQRLQGAAELFLLIEPHQLVVFDLGALTERLIWRKAAVTRLRIVDQELDLYSERVVADDRGWVAKIERRYRPRTHGAYRVMLTRSRRICALWMAASTRHEGWDKVRRSVAWSRLDHLRYPGRCFTEGDAEHENLLISSLVARWFNPAQAIDGIVETSEGVWMCAGDTVAQDAVLIEPLWLGRGGVPDQQACLVGPAWTVDHAVSDGTAEVRDISRVELTEAPPAVPQTAEVSPGYQLAKRTFDIVGSFAVLVVSLPLFAIAALCIILEDGRPVFYGHLRQGRGGRLFRCWKFRTMYRRADKLTPELAEKNRCDGPQVNIEDDPRVTRVGRVLRNFQVDEFPQFWNVLLGQMSIVGPRPSPDEENQYCPAWREQRLSVRPGITGLWQTMRTRAEGEDFQEWIKYDIEYVRRASFWLDLRICLKTAWVLLRVRRDAV